MTDWREQVGNLSEAYELESGVRTFEQSGKYVEKANGSWEFMEGDATPKRLNAVEVNQALDSAMLVCGLLYQTALWDVVQESVMNIKAEDDAGEYIADMVTLEFALARLANVVAPLVPESEDES